MALKITPFLWFEKDCEEAINFYVSTFNTAPKSNGNSKIISIQKYPDNIPDAPWPTEVSGKVLTAVFELEGQRFMALDGGVGIFPKGGQVSLLIDCDTQGEIDYYWSKLSAVPASEQCGWCKDKFGLSWQVNPNVMGKLMTDPDARKVKAVIDAFMPMKKLDIAALQEAYDKA